MAERPWLVIEHPQIGKRLEFADPIGVSNWIYKEEIPAWQAILDAIPKDDFETVSGVRALVNQMVIAFNQLFASVNQVSEENRSRGSDAMAEAIKREVLIAFGQKRYLSASTREIQFLRHCIEQYPRPLAAGVADFILKRRLAPDQLRMTTSDGQMLGLLQAEGVVTAGDYEPIKRLRDDLERRHQADRAQWEKKHEADHARVEAWLRDEKSKAEKLIESYKEIEIVAEPISYWNQKRRGHFWTAIAFAVLFILVIGAGGFGLIQWMMATQQSIVDQLLKAPKDANATLAIAVVAQPLFAKLLAALGLFWILRIITRILLAQLHLHADAGERVVMGKTYLSLLLGKGVLEGKPGIEKEHFGLILGRLFQPAPSGILPDDVAPQISALAELTKLSKSKGEEH
ncbi:MAG TPA: DUF6161 domain-containing protein [Planctomycetaceae bacterium]|jgi:hypothetical protein|nr:DUF6161 domain-containing protein [Planctomycetaceae bacterium]